MDPQRLWTHRPWIWTGAVLFMMALDGCATFSYQPTAPALGVPKISAFRIEPSVVRVGEEALLSFRYEDGGADITEGYLRQAEVRNFSYIMWLQSIRLDMKGHFGKVAGKVEVPLRWEREGIRLYEVYVIDKKGNKSNKLRAMVTVK